jgi:hypothetical protein
MKVPPLFAGSGAKKMKTKKYSLNPDVLIYYTTQQPSFPRKFAKKNCHNKWVKIK